jgi:hypothetical protein
MGLNGSPVRISLSSQLSAKKGQDRKLLRESLADTIDALATAKKVIGIHKLLV